MSDFAKMTDKDTNFYCKNSYLAQLLGFLTQLSETLKIKNA
jgi:hypothetical protein